MEHIWAWQFHTDIICLAVWCVSLPLSLSWSSSAASFIKCAHRFHAHMCVFCVWVDLCGKWKTDARTISLKNLKNTHLLSTFCALNSTLSGGRTIACGLIFCLSLSHTDKPFSLIQNSMLVIFIYFLFVDSLLRLLLSVVGVSFGAYHSQKFMLWWILTDVNRQMILIQANNLNYLFYARDNDGL